MMQSESLNPDFFVIFLFLDALKLDFISVFKSQLNIQALHIQTHVVLLIYKI